MLQVNSKVKEFLEDNIQKVVQDGRSLYLVGPITLPVALDGKTVMFRWYSWLAGEHLPLSSSDLLDQLLTSNLAELQQSSVLVYGDFEMSSEAVVRMHSICHTGDIFGSKRCDCGFQLRQSMRTIVECGAGALFYLANHEGRGIGLFSKALTYLLQEQGLDTVEANRALGFEDDIRSYEEAVTVLKFLRQKQVTILTNNPKKLKALQAAGLSDTQLVNLWGDISDFNSKYLKTKIDKSGHIMKKEQQEEFLRI